MAASPTVVGPITPDDIPSERGAALEWVAAQLARLAAEHLVIAAALLRLGAEDTDIHEMH